MVAFERKNDKRARKERVAFYQKKAARDAISCPLLFLSLWIQPSDALKSSPKPSSSAKNKAFSLKSAQTTLIPGRKLLPKLNILQQLFLDLIVHCSFVPLGLIVQQLTRLVFF
jgi:hypothetical protein